VCREEPEHFHGKLLKEGSSSFLKKRTKKLLTIKGSTEGANLIDMITALSKALATFPAPSLREH
jgi:hypothetical protein